MEGERKLWLLYFSGKALKNQTFCCISDPTKSYPTKIPEMGASKLRTVQHGWYLFEYMISNDVSKPFLWNPHNLKKIKLPPLKHNGTMFGNCILSCPPNTNHEICYMFLFSSHSPSIFYYQLGDKHWNKVCFYKDIVKLLAMKSGHTLEEKRTYFDNPVYCNSCLYANMWTPSSFIIVVIEKLQNGFEINRIPDLMLKLRPTSFEQNTSHLIGSDDVLFRIEIFYSQDRVNAVFVYKFDCSQRLWEKVESIKDRVFFISNLEPAFACQTINPETEGSRVYIALKNNKFFYIYNIEDNSLVISRSFSNLPKKRSYSRWFTSDTGMTDTLKEEIRKAHQIREKESICVVHPKDARGKSHDESALPLDVVEMIAKRLNNVLDYLHFRATNKLFHLATQPIQWRSSSSMSMLRFDDLSMSPVFVFSVKDKVLTFVHPKHGLEYKHIINFPQGKVWDLDLEICCSKDGWLHLVAVAKSGKSYQVFFNPFTKEQLTHRSAAYNKIRNIQCFGMSHSPASSKCMAIELHRDELSQYITPKVKFNHLLWDHYHWDAATVSYHSRKFSLYNTSPVFHNGLFYCLSIKGKLGVIEVIRRRISWKELEEPQAPCYSYLNNFLVACDGNLLSVFESHFPKGVQVFKLNESKMKWMKVENLKNHMLFVGKTSFSAVANIPGMENKIYFPRFYGKSVVFYSLETNNYHTFENEVVNLHQVREHLDGSWIQPRWN